MWWAGCLWLSLKFGGVVLCNCNCICSRTSRWNLHIDLKVLFLCFDSSLPHQGPQSRNLHSKLVFIFLEGSENATPRSVGHDKHASRFWLLGLHLPTNLLATSKQQPTGILLHLALFSLRWQFWQAFVTFLSGSDLQHCKIKAIGNLQSVVEPRSLQAVLLLNFRNFLRQTLCLTTWTACLEPCSLLSATFAPFWASVCTQASFQAPLHLSSSLKLLLSTDF